MTTNHDQIPYVLSIHPITQGYAFVLFEGPTRPVEWGVREIQGKVRYRNGRALLGVELLLDRYRPDYVVLEDVSEADSKRGDRLRQLYRGITHAAQRREIAIEQFLKEDVQATFEAEGATTKYDIAEAVARLLPALSSRLPAKPRAWESQPAVMGMFYAAALAVTFYGDGRSPGS